MGIGTDSPTGADVGYIWTRETGIRYFPDISGGRNGNPVALNNRGQVVGLIATDTGVPAPFVWTFATGFVDLNTRIPDAPPGLRLTAPVAISDNGAIVANSTAGLVLLLPRPVSHAAPVVGSIAFTGKAAVNGLLSFSAGFRDADLRDTHSATWSWGDGSKDRGIVNGKNGAGSVSGQHAYRKAGIYTVRLTVTDSGGKSTTVQRKVAVRGRQAAVAGEDSFVSLPGALRLAP